MTFSVRFRFSALVAVLLLLAITACEQDPTTIGSGVVGSDPFTTDKAVFDVFAYNKKIEAVSTNRLPVYQLGSFTHPVFGKTEATVTSQVQLSSVSPTFGVYAQSTEDNPTGTQIKENEKVDSVYLYIPFLTNPGGDSDGDGLIDELDREPDNAASDSDRDGVSDAQEISRGTDPNDTDTDDDGILDGDDTDFTANAYQKTFDIDSVFVDGKLYGPSTGVVNLNLKVERSSYYLRDLDPSSNFEEAQEYYSNQEFAPTFVDSLLFDGTVSVSPDQIPLKSRDDESTEDVDESENFTYLNPGIRVPLDKDFFQNNILNKEGEPELSNQEDFKNFFRGVHFSLSGVSQEVMMLLDLKDANILISYSYDESDSDGNVSEGTGKRDFQLNFISSVLDTFGQPTGQVLGNAANSLNSEPFSGELSDAFSNPGNAEKIYLKGGAGSYAEIKLFDEDNGESIIEQIRNNNWVINEANLVFYVADDSNVEQPPLLYLFNTESTFPVYGLDVLQSSQVSVLLDDFYDGRVEKSSDGKAVKYIVKITDHINDLLIRDVDNATLGLTVTPSLLQIGVRNAMLGNNVQTEIPVGSSLTSLGTVLYGSNVSNEDEDKKLRLEIQYTEVD